ncbi:hypothetical protein Cni_G10446 [Canna indica]|uniref:RecQ-mediated genome instability protein 1 n=1 Tax=Canna indica TaxID=4628 RepID=A0AAQ3K5S5_9LILI|nr:hypothetical protein Cni_G10446 [Canna indica]
MRRRHLRLPSSSDEEDDAPQPQTLIPPNPNPPTLEITDEDFVDVEDDLSPPSPPPTEAAPQSREGASATVGMVEDRPSSVGPIDDFLWRLGLRLRPEWLESCAAALMAAGAGFERMDVAEKAKRCFEQFLLSDMNISDSTHPTVGFSLSKFQVDEIVNISTPLRERYHDAPAGYRRCLKLLMTDGVQRVFGTEYRPIKELEVLAPSGLKVVVRNVQIRRGLLMLVPEVIVVLGGLADDLDAARKRLVAEVNKPPRGKRKRGNLNPLSTRARLAAWPSNAISGAQTNSTPQNPNELNILDQESGCDNNGPLLEPNLSINSAKDMEVAHPSTVEDTAPAQNVITSVTEESVHIEDNISEEPARGNNRIVMEPNLPSNSAFAMEITDSPCVEDTVNEVEHPLILSATQEIPFTYLACLFAKWTTQKDNKQSIQGRIKCFLTGVKGFQFKHRSTYELCVYVDDGSLISEIIIDHNVVQKGIGHSPEEVTSALSSTDRKTAADVRETMKRFQLFLAKFEGIMLLEINRDSSLPVALEMKQGIPTSDAYLLLRRLKKTASLSSQHNIMNPIDLSP